jgi:hypothetical protein
VQAAQAALSSLHSKRELASLELKVKLAEVEVVDVAGPLAIDVCGGVVSVAALIDQLRSAGLASVFLTASKALTENLCGPTARPE